MKRVYTRVMTPKEMDKYDVDKALVNKAQTLFKIKKILKQNGYKRIDSGRENTEVFEVYANTNHPIKDITLINGFILKKGEQPRYYIEVIINPLKDISQSNNYINKIKKEIQALGFTYYSKYIDDDVYYKTLMKEFE